MVKIAEEEVGKGHVKVEVTVDVELDENIMKLIKNIRKRRKSKKDKSTE